MKRKNNLGEIFRNYASDNILLETLIILQDSDLLSSNSLTKELEEELNYLYGNLKSSVKITLLNGEISSHRKFSDSIEYIISHRPDNLKIIFITSEYFKGEDIQPRELEKKFAGENEISFFKRENGYNHNPRYITKEKGSIINFLSERELLVKNKREVA